MIGIVVWVSCTVPVIFDLLLIARRQNGRPFFVLPDYEIHHAITEIADTIKEDYGKFGAHSW